MARRMEITLDRDRVLAAAFAVVQAEGLDALTMRRLAAQLSVQAPALYWYLGDKAELLSWMAAAIYADARASVPAAEDWRGWLTGFGHMMRASLKAHRDGARICAIAKPSDIAATAERRHAIAAPLMRLGLDEDEAVAFQASVISLALGWATFEANGPMHDYLGEILDIDAAFTLGLTALVRGYRA